MTLRNFGNNFLTSSVEMHHITKQTVIIVRKWN